MAANHIVATAKAGSLTTLIALSSLSCGDRDDAAVTAMYRGNQEHTGVYDPPSAADWGRIAWTIQTGGPVRSTPVIVDGEVYVGSGDGYLYAADAVTGAIRWRFRADGAVQSSPAVHHGLVLFGDRGNRFYAVDRDTGVLRWKVETGPDLPWEWGYEGWDYFTSSPVLAGDVMIVGSGDGAVYALDVSNGAERWHTQTAGRIRSSPAVHDGAVFVGGTDGVLYALDLASGEPRWQYETEGAELRSEEFGFDRKTIQSSPAVSNGTVFFGSRDGGVYAVAASTGELLWRHANQTSWVVTAAAVGDFGACVGGSDGLFIECLDPATGDEIWKISTQGRVFSSPVVAGDRLYVGSHDQRLRALDVQTGDSYWELILGAVVMSSPAIADGVLHVGADDGVLYAISLEPSPAPRRVVYWDPDRLNWNLIGDHEMLRDHFAAAGYEVVNRQMLATFMADRIADRVTSVVVFAMDDLPTTVAPEPADTVLARRYLDSGGKIVWFGLAPAFVGRDAAGSFVDVDRRRPTRLLGIDHGRIDTDQYAAHPTTAGGDWGLGDWWISRTGVDPDEVTEVLAVDEQGAAAAWVKNYGGPRGTGFVQLWGSFNAFDPALLDQFRTVAERGIVHAFPAERRSQRDR